MAWTESVRSNPKVRIDKMFQQLDAALLLRALVIFLVTANAPHEIPSEQEQIG